MCYDKREVFIVENEKEFDIQPEDLEPEPYKPRPFWQVWGARIGLVLFVAVVIMYYINIARGGR